MDTDELSIEVYKAIIIAAENFSHDLTLQYGVLSYECANEQEYLDKSEQLTNEILNYDEVELDDLFFGNPPKKEKLHIALKKIISNIAAVKQIPIDKRHYDYD